MKYNDEQICTPENFSRIAKEFYDNKKTIKHDNNGNELAFEICYELLYLQKYCEYILAKSKNNKFLIDLKLFFENTFSLLINYYNKTFNYNLATSDLYISPFVLPKNFRSASNYILYSIIQLIKKLICFNKNNNYSILEETENKLINFALQLIINL